MYFQIFIDLAEYLKRGIIFSTLSSVELVKLILGHWLWSSSKCSIWWLMLRVYLDLYAPDLPLSTFYILVLFSPKHPIVEAFLVEKTPTSYKINFGQTNLNLGKNTFKMWVWKSLNDWSVQNKSLRKHCIQKLHIAVKHLYPCYLTNLIKIKYLEVRLGQSGAYKPKCTLKTLLSQNIVHVTWRTNSVLMD